MRVLPISNYKYRNNYVNMNTTPSFAAHLDKDIFKKVKQEKLYNEYITPDKDGNLSMHKAYLKKTQEIHRALKDYPEVIVKIHMTPNIFGDLPIHKADAKKTQEIHRVLPSEVIAKIHTTPNIFGDLAMHQAGLEKTQEIHRVLPSKLIAKIHTTPDKDGNLPMHLVDYLPMHKGDLKVTQEIHRALKDYPKIIARIHTTPNKDGNVPMYYTNLQTKKEIIRALEDQPKVLAKIFLTKCPISQSDLNEAPEIWQTIYDIATNSDVDKRTSIELLETYGKFSPSGCKDEIETLKRQYRNNK